MQEHRRATGPRLDALYQHAADMRLDVEWTLDLPARRHGAYLDDRRLILLNYRCTSAQALSALAHEVAHAIYGDRCSTPPVERRADELGSLFIIAADDYAAAEELVGPHVGALARELGVTERMVLAWRRRWQRHYLTRRLGD